MDNTSYNELYNITILYISHSKFLAEQLGVGSERKTKDGKQRQKHPVDGRRKRATLTGFYFSFDPSLIIVLPCQLIGHWVTNPVNW